MTKIVTKLTLTHSYSASRSWMDEKIILHAEVGAKLNVNGRRICAAIAYHENVRTIELDAEASV